MSTGDYRALAALVRKQLHRSHADCSAEECIQGEELEELIAEVLEAADKVREGHCRYGHPWTPENTYIPPSGTRMCRTCISRASKRYRERKKETSS